MAEIACTGFFTIWVPLRFISFKHFQIDVLPKMPVKLISYGPGA